jgi:hypothetical protein
MALLELKPPLNVRPQDMNVEKRSLVANIVAVATSIMVRSHSLAMYNLSVYYHRFASCPLAGQHLGCLSLEMGLAPTEVQL